MTKKSIGVSSVDRFLVHVPANPGRVRMALLSLVPRPWVFVIQTNSENPHYGYDIYISNEWGGYPGDKLYNACKAFADNLVAPVKGDPTVEVVELVADEREATDERSEQAS